MNSEIPTNPRITIDDRERASGLAETLRKITASEVVVARLTVGDIEIGEQILIERKAAADFVASLVDGRLERQLHELAAARKQGLLLIEGEFQAGNLAGLAPQAVRQAILSIELDRRIPVIRSRDREDSARWIVALAERHRHGVKVFVPTFKPVSGPGAPHPAGHRAPRRKITNDPQAIQIQGLRKIQGLGVARARMLLEHFGSIQALMAAGEEEIAAVKGIGPGLAHAIGQAFSRRMGS